MNVAILGLWHLGSVTAACAARAGHDVTGWDPDGSTVTRLSGGHGPIAEPGLDDLLATMVDLATRPWVKGFTTNPTLMAKAGMCDYRAFAAEALAAIPDRPISFEVFSDDFDEMERQARTIAAWGENVYVKIPVTNTARASSGALLQKIALVGRDLEDFSLDTVKMFHADGQRVRFSV
jgi:hypothetical protein